MVWRPVVLEGVCETIWEVVAGVVCEMTLEEVGAASLMSLRNISIMVHSSSRVAFSFWAASSSVSRASAWAMRCSSS